MVFRSGWSFTKEQKKVLTDNSGGDHHSNVVAEALGVKLRVPDDFGNLRRVQIIIKYNISSLAFVLVTDNCARSKLTVYSMWLLVSGGLKPLASYSPTRTFTRLERNIKWHKVTWMLIWKFEWQLLWNDISCKIESETHSLGPIFLRLWAAVKIWKPALKIFYLCLTKILKIIISVCIKARIPCEYHDPGRCWRFGEQERKCQGSRCSERGLY